MGHQRKVPAGKGSTTTQSNRGRKAHAIEREASLEATTVPEQVPGNVKTKQIYMTVKLSDGFIASDQTGAYP